MHQAVIVYISQEGGEIDQISDLLNGELVEVDWIGSINGRDVPIKIRLSDEEVEAIQNEVEADEGGYHEEPEDEGIVSERAARKARGQTGWEGN